MKNFLWWQRFTVISNKIKKLVNKKNAAYQSYIPNGKNEQTFQVL